MITTAEEDQILTIYMKSGFTSSATVIKGKEREDFVSPLWSILCLDRTYLGTEEYVDGKEITVINEYEAKDLVWRRKIFESSIKIGYNACQIKNKMILI